MLHVSLIFHTENSTHNPSFLLYIQKYHTLCNSISRLRYDQRGGHDTLRGKIPRARRSIEPINGWPKISIPSSFPNSFHEEDELGWIWYREWQEVIRMQFPRRERSLGLISRSVEGGERSMRRLSSPILSFRGGSSLFPCLEGGNRGDGGTFCFRKQPDPALRPGNARAFEIGWIRSVPLGTVDRSEPCNLPHLGHPLSISFTKSDPRNLFVTL